MKANLLWTPVRAVLILLVVNVLAGIPYAMSGQKWQLDMGMLLCGPLYVALCGGLLHLIEWKRSFTPSRLSARLAALGLAAGLVACVATNILSELLHPADLMANEFIAMGRRPLAWVYVALTGPVCEELLFRAGIVGWLIRQGVRPLWAVVTGSLLFALVHMNPAQMLVAALLGLVLGALYCRTGNVLLCGALHILNNTIGMVSILLDPDPDSTPITDFLGSEPLSWAVAVALAVLSALMLRVLFVKER